MKCIVSAPSSGMKKRGGNVRRSGGAREMAALISKPPGFTQRPDGRAPHGGSVICRSLNAKYEQAVHGLSTRTLKQVMRVIITTHIH